METIYWDIRYIVINMSYRLIMEYIRMYQLNKTNRTYIYYTYHWMSYNDFIVMSQEWLL